MNRFEKLRHYISEVEGRMLSAKELSRLLGFSEPVFGRLERGDTAPSKRVAAKLEVKYGVSKEWFLTADGLAPWEEEKLSDWLAVSEQMVRDVVEGKTKSDSDKIHAGFGALCLLLKTPQKKLVNYFIEAGRNSKFRRYIYNVLHNILEDEVVNVFKELQQAREKASDLTFEPTEIVLKFPKKSAALSEEESERWDQNELALHRWEKTSKAFEAPTEVLEKFCRQVVGLYAGGKPKDIGDLLKDFMEDNKK